MKSNKLAIGIATILLTLSIGNNISNALSLNAKNSNNIVTSNSSVNSVQVNATVGSTFSVSIPKTIELYKANANIEADYQVKIKGDIAGDEVVKVIPDRALTMSQEGKSDIYGTIIQTVTTATSTEISNSTEKVITGKISVSGATSGTWSGNFNFDIGLSTK